MHTFNSSVKCQNSLIAFFTALIILVFYWTVHIFCYNHLLSFHTVLTSTVFIKIFVVQLPYFIFNLLNEHFLSLEKQINQKGQFAFVS